MIFGARLAAIFLFLVTAATAQDVFAHVIVGNTFNYDATKWQSDIALAQNYGIDAFVLNIATPLATSQATVSNAFQAADAAGFKLFFSFDYLGGAGPWPAGDVSSLLKQYASHPSYFKYNNAAFVSTFEGTGNIGDWAGIRGSVPGGIFFMPDWTSLGPDGLKANLGVVDGFFSWDMWPSDPTQKVPTSDTAYINALGGKPYMMGISPWFYTRLPGYNKAWVFNVDTLWYSRWEQALTLKPQFIELVTWNDFGESHYLGPVFQPGVPTGAGTDATAYVDGMPHEGWMELLPYYVSAYKNGSIPVQQTDKLVYWYRRTPKSAGSPGGVLGGFPYGAQFDPNSEVQDNVYMVALLGPTPGASVQVQIGNNAPTILSTGLAAGANLLQVPFNGQTGNVTVSVIRNGAPVFTGTGATIDASPVSGITNYNVWVGQAHP
ncbi:putative glucan endo-1,3-alpha-glucosidase agn1 precursor [Microthyrium microscopicum]|uniref:Putative glucan endo-1,3-alpha-glucosidase agn1 n=1 Tax=Microthyrium microscopicum TaxID=703497 RepID=A0A6A6U9U4_9PEZI|nr:putative glucan endo-1,3-alpha-glucosidase agn1 precursor [Microthyrium microscopicum]